MIPEDDAEQLQHNPLFFTQRVYFELSNCCNLASQHPLCPSGQMGPPEHLPTSVAAQVLYSLWLFGFGGELRFHMINEPLVDPRLLSVMQLAKGMCPNSPMTIWTNGTMLSSTLADELVQAGMTKLLITAYTGDDYERCTEIAQPLSVTTRVIRSKGFDPTLTTQYDADPVECDAPCGAPLKNLSIAHNGKLVLCCRDWNKRHIFGDLHYDKLEHVLRQPKLWETYQRLQSGDRFLPLCQRCERSR